METLSRGRKTGAARRGRPAMVDSRAGLAPVGARGSIPGGVRRTVGFVTRLLARAQSRATRGRPLEMALRRTPAAEARTMVQRGAPSVASHHHAGPAIHLRVAMQVVIPGPERATVALPRTTPASTVQPILRTVPVHLGAELARPGPAPSLAPPPHPSPAVLRPATGPAREDPRASRAPLAVATVVTTLRREERVRLETVVRRTKGEIAPPPAPAPSGPGPRSSEAAERPQAPRRPSPFPSTVPPMVSEPEITRLADRVVQRIQRRVITQRERMGGR